MLTEYSLAKVVIREDTLLDLIDHQSLEVPAVEVGGLACTRALFEQGAADIIAELAALDSLTYKRLATVSTTG